MKRYLSMVMGLCFFAAACVSAQQRAEPEKIKASGEHETFEWQFLPIAMARVRGLWAANGLDPEFGPAASAAMLNEQVAAGTKIGMANTAEIPLARSQGVPVKIVAGYLGETIAKIYTLNKSQMKSGKDLNGKRVGILAMNHTSFRTVSYLNAKLGIKSESVPLGSLESRMEALKAGRVDAIYSAEGAALPFVDSGELKLLVALPDIYPRPYAAVVIWATDDLIEKRPEIVKNFVKTILEATRLIKENPEQATDLYMERTKAPRNIARRVVAELNSFLTPSGRGSGKDLLGAVAGNWEFTKESGAIPATTNVNLEHVVDASFLP